MIDAAQYIATAAAWFTVFVYPGQARDVVRQPDAASSKTGMLSPLREFLRIALLLVATFTLEVILVTVVSLIGFAGGAVLFGLAGALQVGVSGFVGGVAILVLFHRRSKNPVTVEDVIRVQQSARSAEERRLRGHIDIARGPVATALLGIAGVFFFATGPFFGENSALSLFRLPRWVFELSTTPLASDECLARRGVERAAPLFLPHEPDEVTTPYEWNFDLGSIVRPRTKAYETLARRGPSTLPPITRALERVLARADAEEERRAVRFLMLVARWTGGRHPILDAWIGAPHRPPGHELVEGWRVCLEKHRFDRVGRRVDTRCDFTK